MKQLFSLLALLVFLFGTLFMTSCSSNRRYAYAGFNNQSKDIYHAPLGRGNGEIATASTAPTAVAEHHELAELKSAKASKKMQRRAEKLNKLMSKVTLKENFKQISEAGFAAPNNIKSIKKIKEGKVQNATMLDSVTRTLLLIGVILVAAIFVVLALSGNLAGALWFLLSAVIVLLVVWLIIKLLASV